MNSPRGCNEEMHAFPNSVINQDSRKMRICVCLHSQCKPEVTVFNVNLFLAVQQWIIRSCCFWNNLYSPLEKERLLSSTMKYIFSFKLCHSFFKWHFIQLSRSCVVKEKKYILCATGALFIQFYSLKFQLLLEKLSKCRKVGL